MVPRVDRIGRRSVGTMERRATGRDIAGRSKPIREVESNQIFPTTRDVWETIPSCNEARMQTPWKQVPLKRKWCGMLTQPLPTT